MAKVSDARVAERPWLIEHWKLSVAVATVVGWLLRRATQPRIKVDRVSDRWLMEHEVEEGREGY